MLLGFNATAGSLLGGDRYDKDGNCFKSGVRGNVPCKTSFCNSAFVSVLNSAGLGVNVLLKPIRFLALLSSLPQGALLISQFVAGGIGAGTK
jgi:hypothetical protein